MEAVRGMVWIFSGIAHSSKMNCISLLVLLFSLVAAQLILCWPAVVYD